MKANELEIYKNSKRIADSLIGEVQTMRKEFRVTLGDPIVRYSLLVLSLITLANTTFDKQRRLAKLTELSSIFDTLKIYVLESSDNKIISKNTVRDLYLDFGAVGALIHTWIEKTKL